jgi:DNA polymerase-3 subunit delta'
MTTKTGYDFVIGYKDIKAMLKKAVNREKISPSYIFCGEAGSGKTLMASMFSAALMCEKNTGDACMECASCKKVQSRNHPDIIVVQHEKPESIGVDDIRRGIVDDIYIKPFESRYKIYIIPEAQMMTVQAQNALLKTLEEPPQYAVIILLAESTEGLLPTVVSRCTVVRFSPLDDDTVKEYLEKELMIPEYSASVYAALAMGKIGVAKKLALSDDFSEKMNESLHYLKKSKDIDPIERIDFTKRFSANKKEIFEYLDFFTIWFRDVLLFKATKEKEDIIIKDELSAIKKRASLSSYEGLQVILDAIDNARVRLRANVNPELVMELLLLTISEN